MRGALDKQLAGFLRKARSERTYVAFARQLGLPVSTLHRLESGEQSATLGKLDQIMKRLKCSLSDISKDCGPLEIIAPALEQLACAEGLQLSRNEKRDTSSFTSRERSARWLRGR